MIEPPRTIIPVTERRAQQLACRALLNACAQAMQDLPYVAGAPEVRQRALKILSEVYEDWAEVVNILERDHQGAFTAC
jgi:hypothetical protein